MRRVLILNLVLAVLSGALPEPARDRERRRRRGGGPRGFADVQTGRSCAAGA